MIDNYVVVYMPQVGSRCARDLLMALAVLLLVGWSAVAHAQSATYRVTFEGKWTTAATATGVAVPGGAHFSPLIGAVHNDQVTFWSSGDTASAGIESMAEVGQTSALKSEITAAGSDASSPIERSGNIGATATVTVDVTVSPTHPLVTLVTMIAPSPDWFVGVTGLSLLDAQNDWLASHTVDLFPYDAGTEDGTEFSLSNAATSPQGTITSITGMGKFSNEPIATLTFTKVDEAGTVTLFPAQPRVGTVLRARVSDPDGNVRAVRWQWATSSDGVNWMPIDAATKASYTPTDDDQGMSLRATATYKDGSDLVFFDEASAVGTVGERAPAPELSVLELVSGLSYPWGIAFTPDGTMLFTQRPGVLSSRLTDGTLQTVTADLSDLFVQGTTGLMGIATDPDFASNRRFYTCQGHTEPDEEDGEESTVPEVQVSAWTIDDDYTTATRVADPLVDDIPVGSGGGHGGCRLRFGPEDYLWISTGDGYDGRNPQDLSSLGGKILRVDPSTGAGPPTNPFAPSRVYTYGHRHPQGLALRPGTDQMWSVEHGTNVDDEINLLVAGGNYGWNPVPNYIVHSGFAPYLEAVPMTDLEKFPDAIAAKWASGNPTLATSGGIFLEGDDWDDWEGRLAVATLKEKSLRVFEFTEDGTFVSQVVVPELDHTYGRLRTPVLGPDGALYVTTSKDDDEDYILRVTGSQAPAFLTDTQVQSVEESSSTSNIVAKVLALDPKGETLTYTLSGSDAASFTIPDDAVGALRANVALDYETKDTYEVIVTATNPDGMNDSVTLTITVTDVNEPPVVSGPATVFYAEGSTAGVASYSATDPEGDDFSWEYSGPDYTAFALDANQNLTFTASPDYEVKNSYAVRVTATDSGGHAHSVAVTVTITNVDEAGTVSLTGGTPPQVGQPLTATLSDPDGMIREVVWVWEWSADQNDWSSITGAPSDQYTPQRGDVGRYLRVTATYTDGHGPGKRAQAAPAAAVALPPSTQVVLAVDRATVSEGVGSTGQAVQVTGTLDGATRAQATVVQVTVAGSGAAGVVGFEAVAAFSLTIAAEAASGTAPFTLTPADDTTDEGDETVTVGGTTAELAVIPAELTITDDEPPPVVTLALSAENNAISENEGVSTVTATLNHPSSRVTTVEVAAEAVAPAVAGDVTLSPNPTLTILAGQTASSGTAVTLTARNNRTDAPNKQVTVSGTASNTLGVTGPAVVTLTIEDDEPPPTVMLVLTPQQIDENEKVSTVTATLSHLSSETTTVQVSAVAVDPAVGTDFTLSPNTTLTIPAGATASMGEVTLTSVDNPTDAPNKQVRVSGTASNGYDIAGNPADEILLLTDDEPAPRLEELAWSVTPITEAGGQSTLTVTLSHPSSAEIVVTVTAAPAEAVTPSPAEVRIPAGQTAGTVTLTAEDNDIDGPETTAVTVTAAVETYLLGTIASATAPPLTITDDDDPPTVTLAVFPTQIAEAGGVSTVTATLNRESSEPIVVTVADAPAYTFRTPRTLTFPAEETASQDTVTLEAEDNAIDAEDAEVMVGGTASNNLVVNPAELTITDDDTRGVTVAPTALSLPEGGTDTYTVVLASEPTETVTISVESSDAAVDSVSPESLKFTTATWNTPQPVTVEAVDDEVMNTNPHTGTITHTVTGGDYETHGVQAAAVAVTVTDDESPSTTVQLRVQPTEVLEGASRTVTVTGELDGAPREGATVVTLAVRAGTAGQADFTAEAETLTIQKEKRTGSAVLTLTEMDDGIDEPDEETVTVDGSTTVGLAVTATEVIIRDTDAPPTVTLVRTPDSISEDGQESSRVTARLSHPSSEDTEVTVVATAVPPAVAADFTLSGAILTIPAGQTASSGSVTLTAEPNEMDEADKEVTVSGTATNALDIAGNPADVRLSITDDDPPEVEGERAPRYEEGRTEPVATYTATNPDPQTPSITWSLAGADKEAFTIANGVLRFTSSPDHEASRGSVYDVTVEASDGTLTGTLAVTVTVEDALGTVDLPPTTPQIGTAFTATVSDPDEVDTDTTEWCWARSSFLTFPSSDPSTRDIDCDTTTTDTYTPVSADLGYFLRATVEYTDGQGTFKAGVAAVTAESVLPR